MAVEAASFNISIEAISFGLISASGLSPKFCVPFKELTEPDSIGIPSTTNKGLLPEFKEELPLTRIVISPPGAPEFEVTCTPAALPCNIEIGSCSVRSEERRVGKERRRVWDV